MSEFTKAAERAADAVMNIASDNNIYNTDRYRESDIWEKITNKMEAEIAKHFADLAATYELLVELYGLEVWLGRYSLRIAYAEAITKADADEFHEKANRHNEIKFDNRIQRAIGGTEK